MSRERLQTGPAGLFAGLRYTTHLHQNSPWLYKLSRGYDAPEIAAAVERIGAEQQAKRAA